ncbi:hypothetical protein [Treponema sp.]|uniref:hypothetical protein n=1 Tax=Treponema sp. TaxID=166 RepID=UPI003FD726C3
MALLSFSSCIIYVDNIPDSEVFKSFEPLEWSDDYVFLPTDLPQQIQVWNSKTKKLVYTYELLKEMKVCGKSFERALSINDMVVIDKDIWLSGTGVNNNLLKINVPTGQVKYINQKDYIYSMSINKSWENCSGCLWGMNYCQPNDGFSIWQYDLNGNFLSEKKINYQGLCISPLKLINYIDDEYYILGSFDWGINNYRTNKEEYFKIIKINEKVVNSFPLNIILTEEVLNDLKYNFNDFSCSLTPFKTSNNEYLELSLIGDTNENIYSARFLFKITNWTSSKIEVEYTGINYQDEESRAICTVSENEENLFLTGRVLYGNNFTGLETGVYSKATGKELYRMRMENSNQLHCEIKDDKTWFPQDVNLQDQNLKRYSIPKGCYMLDHKTGKTYWYDENGNGKEIERISGQLK